MASLLSREAITSFPENDAFNAASQVHGRYR
jgi:hypothetical protein